MTAFSLLLADTVRINAEGVPEILTKIAKDFVSVSYNINDKVIQFLSSTCCQIEWSDLACSVMTGEKTIDKASFRCMLYLTKYFDIFCSRVMTRMETMMMSLMLKRWMTRIKV